MRELLAVARRALGDKGAGYVIRSGIDVMFRSMKINVGYLYHTLFRLYMVFAFQGSSYIYFFSRYNTTWRNEWCVEIPIVLEILGKHQGREILEVGNVLSHYCPVTHDIVDKYEVLEGSINQDVAYLRTSKKYNLFLSISTMEDVGRDGNPCDRLKIQGESVKILRALGNLQGCLALGGMIVMTICVGYNSQLDRSLAEGKIVFCKQLCLKRISKNKWVGSDWVECREARYGTPYTVANALVILFISKR